MKIGVIHLSDLHYRLNWHEDQGVVLSEFFTDLEKSIRNSDVDKLYLAFSGDIVQAGDKTELFTKFIEEFDSKLNALGITKSQRICVPGNHDVSTKIISDSLEAHQGIMSLELDETKFNNLLSRKSGAVLCEKFNEYLDFQEKFSDIGITRSSVSGAGWSIDDNLGIYCLNSALCSSGGLNNKEKGVFDKGRLCIDTRSLQEWNIKCKSKFKILIMH